MQVYFTAAEKWFELGREHAMWEALLLAFMEMAEIDTNALLADLESLG